MDNAIKHRSGSYLHLGSQQGFTLIEMLVSILILSVIMTAMFSFLWGMTDHWATGKDTAEITDNARIGLNRMTRELKQASILTDAQPNQVSFIVDFGSGPETITYGFTPGTEGDGGVLWRETTTAPGEHDVILMNDIVDTQFTYYGNDYKCDTQTMDGTITFEELQACSADPIAKVARIDINLSLQTGDQNAQTFLDQAWLRNRVVTS